MDIFKTYEIVSYFYLNGKNVQGSERDGKVKNYWKRWNLNAKLNKRWNLQEKSKEKRRKEVKISKEGYKRGEKSQNFPIDTVDLKEEASAMTSAERCIFS